MAQVIPLKKKKGGRPKGSKTRKYRSAKTGARIREMAKYGMPQKSIARICGTDVETMLRMYRDDWELGQALAHEEAGKAAWRLAVQEGDKTMLIFYLKAQMGWSEKTRIAIEDADGGSVFSREKLLASMSPGDLAELLAGVKDIEAHMRERLNELRAAAS